MSQSKEALLNTFRTIILEYGMQSRDMTERLVDAAVEQLCPPKAKPWRTPTVAEIDALINGVKADEPHPQGVVNLDLLNQLIPYKLKIMPDVDGDVEYVRCVIRASINPLIAISSDDVFYKAADMSRCARAQTYADAVNVCLVDLIAKLDKYQTEKWNKHGPNLLCN